MLVWMLIDLLVKEKISINVSRSIKNVSRNIKVIIKKYLVIEYVSNVSRSVKKIKMFSNRTVEVLKKCLVIEHVSKNVSSRNISKKKISSRRKNMLEEYVKNVKNMNILYNRKKKEYQ